MFVAVAKLTFAFLKTKAVAAGFISIHKLSLAFFNLSFLSFLCSSKFNAFSN